MGFRYVELLVPRRVRLFGNHGIFHGVPLVVGPVASVEEALTLLDEERVRIGMYGS
jgi:hypothetical protein